MENKVLLKFFYKGRIPMQGDLTKRHKSGKAINLEPYFSPFRGQRKELFEAFGEDFSEPLDYGFEKAIEDFYETIIRLHWNRKAQPPTAGFRLTVQRACRAGVMYRCGFNPPFSRTARVADSPTAAKLSDQRKNEKLKQLLFCDAELHSDLVDFGILSRKNQLTSRDLANVRQWLLGVKEKHPNLRTIGEAIVVYFLM